MDLTRLKAVVAALSTVGESVGVVIDELVGKLRAAISGGASQEELDELVNQLEAERDEIIANVKRGTIAEDEPIPPGAPGSDTIAPPAGDDSVDGGAGEDTLTAGQGDDTINSAGDLEDPADDDAGGEDVLGEGDEDDEV